MDATVLSYVTNLSNGEADTTQAAQYYEDILGTLANLPVLTAYSTGITPSSGNVTFPATAVALLALFWKNAQIGELSVREANWMDANWRTTTGTPLAFVKESFPDRFVQLTPQDSTASSVSMLTSETIASSLPTWLQLPVALLILFWEYSRESDHQNAPLAASCKALGEFTLKLVL